MKILRLIIIVLVAILVVACDNSSDYITGPEYTDKAVSNSKVYTFAVHPLFNPIALQKAYQPLMDYLSENVPDAEFKLEASLHYQDYEAKIREQKADFLLPNPWQTLIAMKANYAVIAEAGDSSDFKGIFIVRKGSAIQTINDLKGKVVSYPSPTALAAAIMPQTYLHNHGININTDISNKYVGSQEAAMLNVYLGESDLAATWPPPWKIFQSSQPDKARDLKVLWETDSLINNSVMAHKRVAKDDVILVTRLLLELDKTESGKIILNASRTNSFNPANDKSYEKVQDYIDRFERDIRRVESAE